MHRNLDRRVEALVRIPTSQHVAELGRVLDLGFDERTPSWWLEPDGSWVRHHLDENGQPLRHLQDALIAVKRRRREKAIASR
jgi:polyphosphate kinase